VLLWNVADHDNGSIWKAGASTGGGGGGGGGGGARSGEFDGAATLAPRMAFKGHTDTVEDVSFHPTEGLTLCSVGDDRALIFWDGRKAGAYTRSLLSST